VKRLQVWIQACRLRTLPLAAASIIVAGGLAQQHQVFNLGIFLLSLLTALLLQILSNLANDYGDALTGADLSFADDIHHWLIFLGLGVAAITAAITYTMGKLPYGYRAMGDIAVFMFFGLLGVLGSFYLQALSLSASILLPAFSVGLLSAAVLNVNNMRDFYSDKVANKITLVVLLGRKKAFIYHLLLIFTAMLCSAIYIYNLPDSQFWQYLFLLIASPLIKSCIELTEAINKDEHGGDVFNEQLKNTAISTFVFSVLFAIALIT